VPYLPGIIDAMRRSPFQALEPAQSPYALLGRGVSRQKPSAAVALDLQDVKVVADPSINAGSAGEGQFLITTGLLRKANDDQLRGILAHEIAQ
jgi:Zn-dependent protease with chaperone function